MLKSLAPQWSAVWSEAGVKKQFPSIDFDGAGVYITEGRSSSMCMLVIVGTGIAPVDLPKSSARKGDQLFNIAIYDDGEGGLSFVRALAQILQLQIKHAEGTLSDLITREISSIMHESSADIQANGVDNVVSLARPFVDWAHNNRIAADLLLIKLNSDPLWHMSETKTVELLSQGSVSYMNGLIMIVVSKPEAIFIARHSDEGWMWELLKRSQFDFRERLKHAGYSVEHYQNKKYSGYAVRLDSNLRDVELVQIIVGMHVTHESDKGDYIVYPTET